MKNRHTNTQFARSAFKAMNEQYHNGIFASTGTAFTPGIIDLSADELAGVLEDINEPSDYEKWKERFGLKDDMDIETSVQLMDGSIIYMKQSSVDLLFKQ